VSCGAYVGNGRLEPSSVLRFENIHVETKLAAPGLPNRCHKQKGITCKNAKRTYGLRTGLWRAGRLGLPIPRREKQRPRRGRANPRGLGRIRMARSQRRSSIKVWGCTRGSWVLTLTQTRPRTKKGLGKYRDSRRSFRRLCSWVMMIRGRRGGGGGRGYRCWVSADENR